MVRRVVTFEDRVQIAVGVGQGLSDRQIGCACALFDQAETAPYKQ